MKIELARVNKGVHFEASDELGHTVHLDMASSTELGEGAGMRPMHLTLTSLAGCSSFDVVLILKKMKQPLEDIKVIATAERSENEVPSVFRSIHLHFELYGEIDPGRARRAVELSVEKYCSVGAMLSKSVDIRHSYEILPPSTP